ncbi:MAG: alpha/beta hydrolase [Acidimicrobiales bacterium]
MLGVLHGQTHYVLFLGNMTVSMTSAPRRARRAALIAALLTAPLALSAPAARATIRADAGCRPVARQARLVVGTVACQRITTHLLGDGIAAPFAYYVPPECDPVRRVRCPVLYLLHGFGGDFTEMVGTASKPSAWISSLTSRPPAGFESAPWAHADPAQWVAASHIPIILVAPRGQTLPGGYGPGPGLDSYWVDWNPRYAAGGDSTRYATPPPRFESFLLDELIPYVTRTFPTGAGRSWRAIGGVSLGGYGAYKDGLHHPDQFTAMLSISGAMNFLFAPGIDPALPSSPVGVQPPVQLPVLALPAPTGVVPSKALPSQAGTFLTALDALGDPLADHAYFRGNMPRDLAMNARASARATPSFGIDGFVNDTIARRTQDLTDPVAVAYEDVVFPMNIDMQLAFTSERVVNTFAIHPGLHSDAYRNAWIRGLEEFAYARLAHPDGRGTPPPEPTTFDYRSTSTNFSIWGWHVAVARPTVEFLAMRSVSCRAVTLQGSGRVRVTVPPSCHAGYAGATTFAVDLGPSFPFTEPAGAGALPIYGRTVTVPLTPEP